MTDKQDFSIDDPNYSVFWLELKHAASLQRFFEQCNDFNLLVDGEDISPTSAQDIFQEAPPGRSLDDKFMFGILDQSGAIVGILEGMVDYPDQGVWWIGLLMLAPGVRGQGLGRKVVESFAEYVRSKECKSIMLGVVDENPEAYAFWQRAGFEFVRQTEPQTFGKKTHTVNVMRRAVPPETPTP